MHFGIVDQLITKKCIAVNVLCTLALLASWLLIVDHCGVVEWSASVIGREGEGIADSVKRQVKFTPHTAACPCSVTLFISLGLFSCSWLLVYKLWTWLVQKTVSTPSRRCDWSPRFRLRSYIVRIFLSSLFLQIIIFSRTRHCLSNIVST